MNGPSRERAFTLIELMIALAVLALVLTLGVPSFRNNIIDNRQVSELNALVAELNWARSEAVARNTPVTVKRLTSDWTGGWGIFVDRDGDGVLDSDGDGTLCETGEDCELRQHSALPGGLQLSFSWTRVTYDSMGMSQGFNGTFTLCNDEDPRGSRSARGLVLSSNGRVRPARDENSDGYPEDGSGNPLSCP